MSQDKLKSLVDNALKRERAISIPGHSSEIHSNKKDIVKLGQIASSLLDKYEQEVLNGNGITWDGEFWGEKENAVTILAKLSQIMLKIFSAEKNLADKAESSSTEVIAEEDIFIIKNYLQKISDQNK